MKQRNVKIWIFCLLLIVILVMPASGVLIIGDAVLLVPSEWPEGYDYEIYLSQSIPSGAGRFSICLTELDNNVFEFRATAIAELYALYAVDDGTIFDPGFVASSNPLLGNAYDTPSSFSITLPLYQSVYFGYWDSRTFGETMGNLSIYDSYGWFELQNTWDGLVILDGATALGYGIIVGTYQQIPEPGTTALLLLGGGSLILACKKRSNQKTQTARG